MKALGFNTLLFVNFIVCLDIPWNQYYNNWNNHQSNSLYNPNTQYTPQPQQIQQQSIDSSNPQVIPVFQQSEKEQIDSNNPLISQNKDQQSNSLPLKYNNEQIAQFAEKASQINLEETGKALTESEKQELAKELSLIQDYSRSNTQGNQGELNDYNRIFFPGVFGGLRGAGGALRNLAPIAGIGATLAGSAIKGLAGGGGFRGGSGGGGMAGMGGMRGSSIGKNSIKTFGKAAAPIISDLLSGDRPKLGTYINSIITLFGG